MGSDRHREIGSSNSLGHWSCLFWGIKPAIESTKVCYRAENRYKAWLWVTSEATSGNGECLFFGLPSLFYYIDLPSDPSK